MEMEEYFCFAAILYYIAAIPALARAWTQMRILADNRESVAPNSRTLLELKKEPHADPEDRDEYTVNS